MKKILTVNPGSTSIKYKLFDQRGAVLAEHIFDLSETKKEKDFLRELESVQKIGIRVVHGGDLSATSKITKKLKDKIASYIDFAPIHNKCALEAVDRLDKIFPGIPQYAVFDTAFHTTISKELSTYPIPTPLAKKHHIKKYGFHGIAAQSAVEQLRQQRRGKNQNLPNKIIILHLGGGCSVTAVRNGKSFCTSMGLTPISGVMMTTRAGDVDSDLDKILATREKKPIADISWILSNKSGFYGMTGSKDTLKIFNKAKAGLTREKLAFDVFVNQLIEKVWGYAGLMGGVDALVFSGGIGYGNRYLRDVVAKRVRGLNLSKKDIYTVDVDEELVIFNEVKKHS